MTKWHIRDDLNHGRAACSPLSSRDLVISIEDWIGRIPSDQCAKCAKAAKHRIATATADKRRQQAFDDANARHPLPISGAA
jgi:hypothetical protein